MINEQKNRLQQRRRFLVNVWLVDIFEILGISNRAEKKFVGYKFRLPTLPADPFATLGLQNLWHDVSELPGIHRYYNLDALKF